MTATTIDYTNLYSQPSINIFTILNNRTNIPDPRDATGARKFVYDEDPLQKSFDFDGIPYIITMDFKPIYPTQKAADAKSQYMLWTNNVIVRTVKDGSSGSRVDAGITDMRQIMDDIFQTLNDATIKQSMRDWGMFNVEVSVTNTDSTLINQKLLHETTLEITFGTRLTTSV